MHNILSSSLLSKNINIKTYRNIILSVVLYGCETWLLTLREECRLRVFENRVLRKIFQPKKDEVTGELRKLHNEELRDRHSTKYYSDDEIKMRWVGHVAHMGERRGVYRVLVGKPKGKRALGRTRLRLEDNNKKDLQKVRWDIWTGLIWPSTGTGDWLL